MFSAGAVLIDADSQSLQQKLSATLLAVMVGFGLLSLLILKALITPAFENLENKAAQTDLLRAERAIQADLDRLISNTGDWAPWDDAHNYIRGINPAFIEINTDIPTMVNLDINLMAFYDNAGKLHWGKLLVDGNEAEFASLGAFAEGAARTRQLIRHTGLGSKIAGLLATHYGPMLICSMPIVRTGDVGPIAGTVVMAHFLDQDRLTRLSKQTAVDMSAFVIDSGDSRHDGPVRALRGPAAPDTYHEASDETTISYSLLRDVFDQPYMVLRTATPRSIAALGEQTVNATILFLVAAAILVAVVAWVFLRRMIVVPLSKLAAHIVGIRNSGDLSQKLDTDRKDEIGSLAIEFNRMTGEVRRARQLLLDQSFKAGKADTAAEVLHNIRNAMTPLINGLERLSKKFRVTESLRVKDATSQLADAECPADRQQKLLQYIDASFDHLASSGGEAIEELQLASRQAQQVEAILADQERHSMADPIYEVLDLDELTDEAMHVIPREQPDAKVRVSLAPDIRSHRVRAHRVGLQQILGNLILNAYESIQRSQSSSGEISICARQELVETQPMVRLTVRDSGCGFDERTQQKIFQRGYTSKQGQLTGLGLHWCANAIAGMGGRISAESVGSGHGAAFHVLLPDAQGD